MHIIDENITIKSLCPFPAQIPAAKSIISTDIYYLISKKDLFVLQFTFIQLYRK